jgi:hypothetical protein
MIVGLDFDNTVARYDEGLMHAASAHGLAVTGTIIDKDEVRERARRSGAGERLWQEIQAEVYGLRHGSPVLDPDFSPFIFDCRRRDIPVYVVSHKTQFAAMAPNTDLRRLAFDWMQQCGFFDENGLGFLASQVFFEDTRAAKIARIRELRCTHFIDDLPEIFADPTFPAQVEPILFRASDAANVVTSWDDVRRHLFAD